MLNVQKYFAKFLLILYKYVKLRKQQIMKFYLMINVFFN